MRTFRFTHRLLLAVSLAACFDMPPRPQARGDAGSATDGSGARDGQLGDAALGANIVFVSSSTVTGDLGGTSGADATCAGLAHAASLPGTYVAWLGTSTANAPSRLGSARGWVRPDGLPVVDTVADLTAGHMFYPIAIDDLGGKHYDETSFVLTGTSADGTATTDTCSDYTSTAGSGTVGESDGTTGNWTYDGVALACSTEMRLYCFAVDLATPVVPPTPPAGAKLAFVTASAFTASGGLTGTGSNTADGLCSFEANAAQISGTFVALLATNTASAASRVATTNVYARVDGVTLGAISTWSSLPRAPLNVTAAGTYFDPTTPAAWTGAGSAAQPLTTSGSTTTTCDNWTASTGNGEVGAIAIASPTAFFDRTAACSGSNLLYCVEQ